MDIYKMTLYCSEALHSTLTASSSMRTDAWDWEAASLIIATAQASHKWFVCVTTVSLCGLKISYCQMPITKAVSTSHTAHVVTHWISSNRTPTICSPLKKAAWPSEKSRYGSSQPFLFGARQALAWQALAEAHYTQLQPKMLPPANVPAVLSQTSVISLQLNTQNVCTSNKPWSSPWSESSSHTWSVANTKISHLFLSRRISSPKLMRSSLVLHWSTESTESVRVFTAEWLRIKPIREATKLCTQHCTGERVAISKCDYAMPTQSNRSKGAKRKAMWQAPRLFPKSHDVAQTPLRATEPSPKQFMCYSAPKGA